MVDANTKQKIESFAWDCIVGNGRAEEFMDEGHEPGSDELSARAVHLGHWPAPEEVDLFCRAWDACLVAAANP